MYDRTYWVDHVLSETNKFKVIATSLGDDIYTITPYGTVMQNGTFQDAAHFNKVEEQLTAQELGILLLTNAHGQQMDRNVAFDAAIEKTRKAVNAEYENIAMLKNTLKFPFNNSQQTIALDKPRDNANYRVDYDIVYSEGNVGEIIISDKLVNGFKLAYTGSAAKVNIVYKIIGGYNA